MKFYLNIIRNIKVKKSIEAQKLLRAYFEKITNHRKGKKTVMLS